MTRSNRPWVVAAALLIALPATALVARAEQMSFSWANVEVGGRGAAARQLRDCGQRSE